MCKNQIGIAGEKLKNDTVEVHVASGSIQVNSKQLHKILFDNNQSKRVEKFLVRALEDISNGTASENYLGLQVYATSMLIEYRKMGRNFD